MDNFALVKFTPNGTVHPVTDPMVVYQSWTSAENAALQAQQGLLDGSSIAIVMAVATTGFTSPPVALTLVGATVPTTV